jgi:hypothetical protein
MEATTASHNPTRRARRGVRALAVGAILVAGVATAEVAAAQADDAYVGPSTTVLNTEVQQAPVAVAEEQVSVSPAASASASDLAFSGGDAATLALVGGGLLAAGVGVLAVRRRQGVVA